jgi:hypothetical protein
MTISSFCLFWHCKSIISCCPKLRTYLRAQGFNIDASPPGREEVISLQKVDSLVVFGMYREAKKVSAMLGQRDLPKNSFES